MASNDDPPKPDDAGDDTKVRASIKTRELIDMLEAFVLDDGKMTATQAQVAMSLLKKTLPDVPPSAVPARKPTKVTFKWKPPQPKSK